MSDAAEVPRAPRPRTGPPPAEPLRRPSFARFFTADAVTACGLSITVVAVDVLVVQVLEASEAEVGMLRAVQFLPYLLVGLLAGALVDRWRRRPVLVVSHAAAGLALLAIPVLWVLGHLTLATTAAMLFLVGVCGVFSLAAEQSSIPDLVGREQLVLANARIGQSRTVAQTSGPAVGGALVAWAGAPLALLVTAFSRLASAALMATVRFDVTEAGAPGSERHTSEQSTPEQRTPMQGLGALPRRGLMSSMGQGVAFVYRHRTLAPLAVSTHVWFLANSAAMTVFAIYALRHLGLSPVQYGAVLACAGVGGLAGALAAPRIVRRLGEGSTVLLGRGVMPLAWVAMILVPDASAGSVALLAAAKMLYGLAMGVEDPAEAGYQQAVTPRAMLGRMSSTMRTANRGCAALGALAGGVAAGLLGLRETLWVSVVVFILAALIVGLSPLRGARALDHQAR
ncbi:MFS transporter [Nesterenkonia sp. HG001]|uniref:MFS transporter n=1 Tax=Nesterenkonia sp. HG001 TaxID=2983207 RepID=UPI002AC7A85C|nr:MFS transporter [Nesterenkonia sp. HG001]MDZ5076159.1 MFS transporter [Nesterenkonia sp. HG001]